MESLGGQVFGRERERTRGRKRFPPNGWVKLKLKVFPKERAGFFWES